MEEKTRCSRNPAFKYPADEGKGRNSDRGTRDAASFEKPPPLDLCTISMRRGGGKKNPAVENVKRKSAGRLQRADASGGGGRREEKFFDGWNGGGGRRNAR